MAGRKLLKASLNAEVTTQKLLGDKGYVVLSLSVSVAWQVIVINFFFFLVPRVIPWYWQDITRFNL
jgi:hypothetical protein